LGEDGLFAEGFGLEVERVRIWVGVESRNVNQLGNAVLLGESRDLFRPRNVNIIERKVSVGNRGSD
jgi:hypothetical protein